MHKATDASDITGILRIHRSFSLLIQQKELADTY